jgi:gamma-glutamylcyclotransferase (GGCT)/AIG2-like uncharacterized protein YtfP
MQTLLSAIIGFLLGATVAYTVASIVIHQRAPRSESVFVYGTLTIVPHPTEQVDGRIIQVTQAELLRIDQYEQVPHYYTRETITIDETEYWVYIKNPAESS